MFVARALALTGVSSFGMTKNGTQNTSAAWAQITGWTADSGGSVVTSDNLVVQSSQAATGRNITARITAVMSAYGNILQVRIKRNGTVIGTGTAITGGANTTIAPTCTVTGVTVATGDTLSVELIDSSGNAGYGPAVIQSGIGSSLKVIDILGAGMTKNGTQSPTAVSTWEQINNWTAESGSVVTSHALDIQGTQAGAGRSVTVQVAVTKGVFGNNITLRIKRNGTVIGTGTLTTVGASAPPVAYQLTGVTLAASDKITVEMQDTSTYAATSPLTVVAGAGSYVITS